MNDSPSLDPWLTVSDGLLTGLAHALSNRAATLSALAPFLEMDRAADLAREAERLETVVRLMRMLPREPDAPAEPVHVPGLLAEVTALHALQRDLRDVRCVIFEALSQPQPVRVQMWALARALLILLAAAAHTAQRLGAPEVLVGCAGDGGFTVVTLEPSTGKGVALTSAPAADAALPQHELAAVRALVAAAGAEVRSTGAGRYELRLPTVVEARRRERARTSGAGEPG